MLGHEANMYFTLDDTPMISILNSRVLVEEKSKVLVSLDVQHSHLFDKETELKID